ncbi:hypothetical protein MPDQ_008113 [Monascus purpureus]|uniref:RlpA-like protein double-psi beta-barrel domain-containing protein n=1 Tax=Monascus purpureus TaxID=5098 RepID=A0A507QU59_MONPU|nr:hypothetical protein MPDQ_008113 [Monascus purpureus]
MSLPDEKSIELESGLGGEVNQHLSPQQHRDGGNRKPLSNVPKRKPLPAAIPGAAAASVAIREGQTDPNASNPAPPVRNWHQQQHSNNSPIAFAGNIKQKWLEWWDLLTPNRRRLFAIIAIGIAVVILALIIGLSVGLTAGDSSGSDMICAVSHVLFDAASRGSNPNANPLCGLKIRIRRDGESVDVKVVDRCPGCKETDLDVSRAVFKDLADLDLGRVTVEWAWLEDAPVSIN